ncbi:ATP-binding protein [Paenibacillus prosopidis]|uniref:histidine kinase n=1 Tax=Paenibacillus prosopidis TaxID=630520 RepID=A0A368W0G8_9BACL|nr:ATP-binding protein [Paenibacillus prosopidis]RCW47838.1 PAS domain S-box-containing protein [Paenibacillus prosopidis]
MNHPIFHGNPYYLILSLFIMCYASYTMLSMIEQLKPRERVDSFNWMAGGAAVFGLGLWTMHIISLLSSDYMIVINWSMLLVLIACAAITYLSILQLKKEEFTKGRFALSAIMMAIGANLLQYLSMLSGSFIAFEMNWLLFALSFLVSLAGTYLAFYLLGKKQVKYKLKSSLVLGLSNMIMHQLGMQALTVEYRDILSTDKLNDYLLLLAFMLGVATLLILSFSLTTRFASNKYNQIDLRYKLLVENSMDTIALISGGKWEYMNRAGIRMFEVQSEKDIIGMDIYSLLDEKHHSEMAAWLETVQDDEAAPIKPIELQWRTVQGKLLHTEIVRASTTFSGKQIEQVIIRDISERKKNEELLINSEKLYVAGQLAAGIAHEIRNPLTSLKGFLQLIASGRGNKEDFYDIMKSELVRIESIVSELLMLSKPQIYELAFKDARQMMTETVNLLETQAILHNVIIEFHAGDKPLWVMGVENQLKQVFINVIKNAIEAMQNGGVVKISMSHDEDGTVNIRIQDQGSGISKEQLSKIGQPFYTTKDKGTGLGLMVTYKIVDNHKGQITAESEIGTGTTFIIRLPYYEQPIPSG